MDNIETSQSKLSNDFAEIVKGNFGSFSLLDEIKSNFESFTLLDEIKANIDIISKHFKLFEIWDAESGAKREFNFYYVKEELKYKHNSWQWTDFDKWYKAFIALNPAYYDLPWGYVQHTTDENIRYTDDETGITVKLIGVNSVSYELYSEYRGQCHEAQKQGLIWSDENETARIEKFINDVKKEQPKQLQTPDKPINEKIIESFDDFDARRFFIEKDFTAFTDALAIHLSGGECILPNSIMLRMGGIKKIAKAVYEVHYYRGTFLSADIGLFKLMRVLSSFASKTDREIITDMQRTN